MLSFLQQKLKGKIAAFRSEKDTPSDDARASVGPTPEEGPNTDTHGGPPRETYVGAADWYVWTSSGGRGPLRQDQITRLISAGKITERTGIRSDADDGFVAAGDHPNLAHLFLSDLTDETTDAHAPAETLMTQSVGSHPPASSEEASNFVIWASILRGDMAGFEGDMLEIGSVCRPGDELWVLRSRQSVSAIQKLLSTSLGPGDRMFIVDAGRNRMAWLNLGAGAEVELKAVWNKTLTRDAA